MKNVIVVALLGFMAPMHAASVDANKPAPDQNLRLQHYVKSIGADGVQRESRYADLMFRRAGQLWVEREFPAALHADHDHGKAEVVHAGHSHPDTAAAPLWVRRDAAGKVNVQMVLRKQRKTIEVDQANYGNVGYGGSWETAYWLVNPANLKRMRAVGPASHGVQRYEAKQGERTLNVDWDVAGQYPRKVESRNASGTSLNVLTVSTMAAPKALPWQTLGGYVQGDYSDLLD